MHPVKLRNALALAVLISAPAAVRAAPVGDAAKPSAVLSQPRPKAANFGNEPASAAVREVAHRVVEVDDNGELPFLIVDKREARVFVFDASGRLISAAPALLGLAIGDDSVPGIGDRALSTIRPHERTTPAGRFVGSLDLNLRGEQVLWVDYDAGIALHRLAATQPLERRAERLATRTPDDNRISFGCINVAPSFYERVVGPAFQRGGIVYVLPETHPANWIWRPRT